MAGSNPATYLYYDGWNLVQEGSSAANAGRLYVHGTRVDEIVASLTLGAWNYHHYDARGHCILLTGPSGNVIEQYEYDAFGKPYFYNAGGGALNGSSYGNRFLFTGREWLSDLKLYDYRARLYQPELGRFLQPDPKQFAAGDYNLYRYCHNDPVNNTDPTGEIAPVIVAATLRTVLINAAIGATFDVGAQLVKNGGQWSQINKTEVAIAAAVGGSGVGVALVAERAVVQAALTGPGATLLRTALNALGSGATGVTGKAVENVAEGKPVSNDLDKVGVSSMVLGGAGSIAGEGISSLGYGNPTAIIGPANAASITNSAISSADPILDRKPEELPGR
jgi:RHS repeat-associated protein